MWGNIGNYWLEDGVWDMGFIRPGAPRNRHHDGIEGVIVLEDMAITKELGKEPERLGECHYKCK